MSEETEDLKNMIIRLVGLAEEHYNKVWFEKVDNAGAEIMNRLDELQTFKDKQEQGLLIELPCKVGDTIYYIEDGFIYKFKANEIHIRMENGEYIFCIDYMDYKTEDFGKIAFLTEAEAEEALAKMGGK